MVTIGGRAIRKSRDSFVQRGNQGTMAGSFYSQLAALLRSGNPVAVATVVATRGSTPREIGAKMIVQGSGAIVGTIGGGCGEAQVWRSAIHVIEAGQTTLEFVDLTGEINMDSAAVCGGTMEVLVERWGRARGDIGEDLALAEVLVEGLTSRKPMTLATAVCAPSQCPCAPGRRALLSRGQIVQGGLGSRALDEALIRVTAALDEESQTVATANLAPSPPDESPGTMRVFLETIQPAPRLVILGAGHIASPLSRMAKLLDFDVAVLDDRNSFANAARFPEADLVLATGFADGIRQLEVGPGCYVVLITRGHQHDVECLEQLIGSDCAYLGMIGSRRRVRAVFELLGQRGIGAERLARVHAPIGLDLGAKTPAEIALSIMAEIVNVRRGGRASSLSAQRDASK